jgi:hypothetical protein
MLLWAWRRFGLGAADRRQRLRDLGQLTSAS